MPKQYSIRWVIDDAQARGVFQRGTKALRDLEAQALKAAGALQQAHGWSFPSGHASGALVTFGFLAYVALRVLPRRLHAPCMLVAAGLVLLVGASRVFVNAHYASDVLAGFASGSAWLLACILVVGRVRGRASEPGSLGGVGASLSSTSRM